MMPRLAEVKQQQAAEDIYAAVDLTHFRFTTRVNPFDWRLLHGIDVDEVVRINDIASLEAIIPTLLAGSSDAEAALSHHNHVQLYRLVQLSVEHLWQMRESHAKLYPAYVQAHAAALSWKAAAGVYLDLAGRLLCQLQSDTGALLTEDSLNKVAAAREDLEKADSKYNLALDKLEAEDIAARKHTLRRQRLDICWRLVFGVDIQRLVSGGDVAQLEQLLPQVAYGNIMAEDAATLTCRHFRQLLALGQACLDYLWAICMATSRVMEQQVQQLAADSEAIPELTTQTEETRAALAAALNNNMLLMQSAEATSTCFKQPASPVKVKIQASATAAAPGSPAYSTRPYGAYDAAAGSACGCSSWVGHQVSAPCCHMKMGLMSGAAAAPAAYGSYMMSSLNPAAGMLRTKMDQLDWDIRVERERTEAMRMTLADATERLERLLGTTQQQQREPEHPMPSQQLFPHTTFVGYQQSQGGSRAETPSGGVRVVIDEDTIRAQERQAAGQLLSHRIQDIVQHHEFTRKLRDGHTKHINGSPRVAYTSVAPYRSTADQMGPAEAFRRTSGLGYASAAAYADPGDDGLNPAGLKVRTQASVTTGTVGAASSPLNQQQQQGGGGVAATESAEENSAAADAAAVVHRLPAAADEQQSQGPAGGKRSSMEKARDLVRSISPKRVLSSSSSNTDREKAKTVGEMVAAAARAAASAGTHGLGKRGVASTAAGEEQQEGGAETKRVSHLSGWRLVGLGSALPKRKSGAETTGGAAPAAAGPLSVGRSGSSFSCSSVAKAAADVAAVVQPFGRPLTPTEAAALSPLRASIVASSIASEM